MASRVAMLRNAASNVGCNVVLRRWAHAMARPSPFDTAMGSYAPVTPPLALPESENTHDKNIGFHFPSFSLIEGSMELMAVPKKKVSRHKKGLRNGPKALKPVPVIIRCNGIKQSPGEEN